MSEVNVKLDFVQHRSREAAKASGIGYRKCPNCNILVYARTAHIYDARTAVLLRFSYIDSAGSLFVRHNT